MLTWLNGAENSEVKSMAAMMGAARESSEEEWDSDYDATF